MHLIFNVRLLAHGARCLIEPTFEPETNPMPASARISNHLSSASSRPVGNIDEILGVVVHGRRVRLRPKCNTASEHGAGNVKIIPPPQSNSFHNRYVCAGGFVLLFSLPCISDSNVHVIRSALPCIANCQCWLSSGQAFRLDTVCVIISPQ